MAVAFYMDEHVPRAITNGLRHRGVDVLRVQDDGHSQTDDEVILDRAITLGRVMFTRDEDFLAIAHARQASGAFFLGVIFSHERGPTVGDCIRDLEIIAAAYELADIENRVEYLPL